MNYSLGDFFISFTFLALFLGWSMNEPKGVIWALTLYNVASIAALALGAEVATHTVGTIRLARAKKSLRPLVSCLAWKRGLVNLAVILFLSISVVTANYVINEGSHLNPLLFLGPLFGVYVGWRVLGP